jgi:hypothetical protein
LGHTLPTSLPEHRGAVPCRETICFINFDPNTFLNELMRHSALRKTGAFGNESRRASPRADITEAKLWRDETRSLLIASYADEQCIWKKTPTCGSLFVHEVMRGCPQCLTDLQHRRCLSPRPHAKLPSFGQTPYPRQADCVAPVVGSHKVPFATGLRPIASSPRTMIPQKSHKSAATIDTRDLYGCT